MRRARRTLLLFTLLASGCAEGIADPAGGEEVLLDNDVIAHESAGRRHAYLNGAPQVLYLNFEGVTLRPGADEAQSDRSYMVQRDVTLPPFNHRRFWFQVPKGRAEAIADITGRVRQFYAPFNVQVVTARPTSGHYTMVVVGGSKTAVTDWEVIGLAPVDCGNGNPDNVAAVFTDEMSSWTGFPMALVAMVIAHEAGHTFGLDHLASWNAIMAASATDLTAPMAYWRKGPVTTSFCSPEGSVQDSLAVLTQNLGAAPAP